MAVGDDMTESFVSSLALNPMEFGQDGSTLSPEDVAWADSCLTKDPDLSESDWSSLTDALLETLTAQYDSSAHEKDDIPEVEKMEVCSSDEDTKDKENLDKKDSNTTDGSEGNNSNNDESSDDFWSKHNIEDVFLPTYNESLRDIGNSDPEVDLVFHSLQLDQSTEDIFRVWDLDIPPEEDDGLVKQLNKALADGSSGPTSSVSDDSKSWKGLKDESVDDLISGIADLSL